MKTDTWVVVLWPRGRVVAGDSLDRLIKMANESLMDGGIPVSVMSIVSAHSSARAADRAAARLANSLKKHGWWNAAGSAQNAENNQEGSKDES